MAPSRIKIVGTRFGTLESILRKSRGYGFNFHCKRYAAEYGERHAIDVLTFSRCSLHKSDFLNWPEIVLTVPGRHTSRIV